MPEPAGPSTPTIVVAAVLALALGGWWWVSNPPSAEPTGGLAGGLSPIDERPEPASGATTVRVLPGGEYEIEVTDPELATDTMPPPMPEPGSTLDAGRPGFLNRTEIAGLLRPAEDAVQWVGVRLDSGQRYLQDVPGSADYLLRIACRGDGVVHTIIDSPGGAFTGVQTVCDGSANEIPIRSDSVRGTIAHVADGRTRIEAAFQLLPR